MVGYFYLLNQCIRELHPSLVGGGNATFIGCQPPLNLIEEGQGRGRKTNKNAVNLC
jgi:hypothetical protein